MLEKNFIPENIETKHYEAAEKAGAFQPRADGRPVKGTFCIMMPPPNVTGSLHIGHALNYTLQDVLVRYYRMRGFETLWQPGTDHAGIATQMVVERQLSEQGLDRRQLGREKFLEKVWQWKEQSGGTIVSQQRKLGLSPDWSRQRFTMDEDLSAAVRQVFMQLYHDGLIYRDKRLVNWDTKLFTAVSDVEVEAEEQQGSLWYIKYPIKGYEGRFITVATTRPETLFGDTAIAVHPDDERYQDLIGATALVPFMNREITIIADLHCDPEKGSGAVKITPAHDFNDFEVGLRHNLEQMTILDEQGFLNELVPAPFQGLERFAGRKKVVQELESCGLLDKIESTIHAVPYGERSGTVLEPRLTDQWFVNTADLAKRALAAVAEGETRLIPENYKNTYDHWLQNIQPWCISRQLWWGHQIPVWYGPDNSVFVAHSAEAAQAQATEHFGKPVALRQDDDVLDTWFSSALWPFATLGWPQKTVDLEKFYPTSVLITAADILFFWVARMMMMGLYLTKQVPFKEVFLHALVRDEFGKKMSKSKGNVIDPLVMMEKYGVDAVRFTITALTAPGRDIRFSDAIVETYRNFTTKLWNAAKFLESNAVQFNPAFDPKKVTAPLNRWIIAEFVKGLEEVEQALKNFRFDEMATALYRFAWGTYCDWYLELTKPVLYEGQGSDVTETKDTLAWVFGQMMHVLHPIMPFITEELWQNLAAFAEAEDKVANMLITRPWPLEDEARAGYRDEVIEASFAWLIELIQSIRAVRNEVNVPAGAKVPAAIKFEDPTFKTTILTYKPLIERLARLESLEILDHTPTEGMQVQAVLKQATVYINLAGVMDLEAEKARLQKSLANAVAEIQELEAKLSNQKFVANAPEEIIVKNKSRLEDALTLKHKIELALARFKA
jgi:valyl-tRNA synthetase